MQACSALRLAAPGRRQAASALRLAGRRRQASQRRDRRKAEAVYDVRPDDTIAFHPGYWDRPVCNSSREYDYYRWNKEGRGAAAKQVRSDTRRQPRAEEPIDPGYTGFGVDTALIAISGPRRCLHSNATMRRHYRASAKIANDRMVPAVAA